MDRKGERRTGRSRPGYEWGGLALVAAGAVVGLVTCTGNPRPSPGPYTAVVPDASPDDNPPPPDAAPDDATDASPATMSCSDLFDQGVLRDYSVDISAAEWGSMMAEFHNLAALQTGV